MPHYYFHLQNHLGLLRDQEGIDLPDLAAARHTAIVNARDLMIEDIGEGRLNLGLAIEVDDRDGQRVLTLPFDEAVEIAR